MKFLLIDAIYDCLDLCWSSNATKAFIKQLTVVFYDLFHTYAILSINVLWISTLFKANDNYSFKFYGFDLIHLLFIYYLSFCY